MPARRHATRLDPAGCGRLTGQVPDFTGRAGFTVAGTAPDSHRLPFEPPPPNRGSWAAPRRSNGYVRGPTIVNRAASWL